MKKEEIITVISEVNKKAKMMAKGTGQFVGAVYDSSSPFPNKNLPVVLVVGINYGQTGTPSSVVGQASAVSQSEDNIHYFQYVSKLLKKQGLPPDCHVVIWNFYPYLTAKQWTSHVKNSAKEADLIFDKGYDDPIAVFEELVKKLHVQDYHIVFHGVSSAVPILARVAIRKVGRKAILVPNLSRGLVTSRAQIIT